MRRSSTGLALLLAAAAATAEVRTGSFVAPSLGRAVAYTVHLPPGYEKGPLKPGASPLKPGASGPYPVVYALHGLFESHTFWESRGLAAILDRLWAQGELPPLIVVAVDGGNSFFADTPAGRFEELVVHDAVAHVEASYRVRPGRASRALFGISMGGYAALRIAFKRPEAFAAVATHSAMLLLEAPARGAGASRWQMDAFQRVFGNPIDPALWAQADPLAWASRATTRPSMALSFDCGDHDRYGLGAGHQRLHAILSERGVGHEFALLPGDHGYEYVRSVLPRSLRFLGQRLAKGEVHEATHR